MRRRRISLYALSLALLALALILWIMRGPLLLRAASMGSPRAVEVLLRLGADPDAADQHGRTALHIAAEEGNVELARLLVYHGANLNALDKNILSTPLVWAVVHGRRDVAKLLLESGADPNTTGPMGSALENAAGDAEMTELLVTHGARPMRSDPSPRAQ